MIEPVVDPTLPEAILAAIEAQMVEMHVSFPGRVQSFTASRQRADIQPLVKREYANEDGSRAVELMPVLADVPVRFDGSGDYGMTYPLAVGDTVLVICCSCSIDQWLTNGGIVDPQCDRHHNISDAIAFAGLRDNKSAIANFSTNALVLRSPTSILLGSSSASDPVVRKSDLMDFMAALNAAVIACTSSNPIAAPALAALQTALGALTAPAPNAGGVWPVVPSKVKAF